jgi:Domain of unknown function (DUF397)
MLAPNVPTIPSACSADKPQCVEVTWLVPDDSPWWHRLLTGGGQLIEVRDSKHPEVSPALFTIREFRVWLRDVVKPGHWRVAADGLWRLEDLAFTRAEVIAFRDDVLAGRYDLTSRPVRMHAHVTA